MDNHLNCLALRLLTIDDDVQQQQLRIATSADTSMAANSIPGDLLQCTHSQNTHSEDIRDDDGLETFDDSTAAFDDSREVESIVDELELSMIQSPSNAEIDTHSLQVGQRLLEPVKNAFLASTPKVSSQSRVLQDA